MLNNELKEYIILSIKYKFNRKCISIEYASESTFNKKRYGAIYKYRDEDGIIMEGFIMFNKIDFKNYLRKIKLKKITDANI